MRRLAVHCLILFVSLASTACIVDARGEGAEGSFSRQLSVDGPVRLEVETGSGDVDIRTANDGMVRIEGRIRARWSFWDGDAAVDRVEEIERNPPIEQSGNDIRIGLRRRWNNVRVSYTITLPREAVLRLRTGSGDVRVADVTGPVTAEAGSGDMMIGRIAEDLRLRTGSGDVEVDEGAGEIRIETGSGDVIVRRTGQRRADVSTGSGDVEVDGAAAAVRVRTGSGGIRVAGTPVDEWDLSAGSGDVYVNTTATAAFDVYARTGSGDISVDEVVTSENSSRRTLRGRVRGGGPLLSMSTGSGEIRVR